MSSGLWPPLLPLNYWRKKIPVAEENNHKKNAHYLAKTADEWKQGKTLTKISNLHYFRMESNPRRANGSQ